MPKIVFMRYAGGEDLRHVLLSAAEQGECSAEIEWSKSDLKNSDDKIIIFYVC